MIAWQITEPLKLEKINITDNLENVDSVKVKITKVLCTKPDIYSYLGDNKLSSPIIPGQIGVGRIVETLQDSAYFEKNAKVFISPEKNCGECYNCNQNQPERCTNMKISSVNSDGYLREFAVVPKSACYLLPPNVSENDALYLHYISLALTVIDKLKIEKGEHVCVLGGNILANVLCQLIIYYQGVPVMVASEIDSLERAQNSGIYYTIKADNKNVDKEISQITGARMCKKIVYISDSELNTDLIGKLAANKAVVGFAGIVSTKSKLNCTALLSKQLSVLFISSGFSCIDSSVNLLAQKAVNLKYLNVPSCKFENVSKQFKDAQEKYNAGNNHIEFKVDLL